MCCEDGTVCCIKMYRSERIVSYKKETQKAKDRQEAKTTQNPTRTIAASLSAWRLLVDAHARNQSTTRVDLSQSARPWPALASSVVPDVGRRGTTGQSEDGSPVSISWGSIAATTPGYRWRMDTSTMPADESDNVHLAIDLVAEKLVG